MLNSGGDEGFIRNQINIHGDSLIMSSILNGPVIIRTQNNRVNKLNRIIETSIIVKSNIILLFLIVLWQQQQV